jgi:hypothetical protein
MVESVIHKEDDINICAMKGVQTILPKNRECLVSFRLFQKLLFNQEGKITFMEIIDKINPQSLQCFPELAEIDPTLQSQSDME